MAAKGKLGQKAKAQAKKQRSKTTKKRSTKPTTQAQTVEEIEREQALPPTPTPVDATQLSQSPPLPPPLQYIRKLATIPALRRQTGQ